MPYCEFWSEGDLYGLKMRDELLQELLQLCERASPRETGGILLGNYSGSLDCAIVTSVTKAPADSRSGRTWFVRGVRGLQSKIHQMWRRKEGFYLGEWHFHPFGEPSPSGTDSAQMREIASSPQYQCPEPILLIVGGNPPTGWKVRTFIYQRERRAHTEMFQQANSISFRLGATGS